MRPDFRRFVAALSIGLLFLPTRVFAHNHQVHYDMTEISYEIMVAAGSPGFGSTPPQGVDPGEWTQFIADLKAATRRLQQLPTGLPKRQSQCGADYDYIGVGNDWATGVMGAVSHPVSPDYLTDTAGCGATTYKPGGMFDVTNTSSDYTGTVLGLYAASIDDQLDDTHLEIRPTNALGLGAVKKKISELWDKGVGVILIAVYCLFECIFGGCSKCADDAKDAAKDSDPVNYVDSFIPGIGDIKGDDFVGVWHFINLWPTATNQYDDHQGLETDIAFNGAPDTVEVVLMAVTDLVGLSVKPDKSDGVKNYQIHSADDGFSDTASRAKGTWNAYTFAHVAFEPVDNLAYFGWRNFRDQTDVRPTRYLGNVLHALGDASVPMHVAATSGWGHRPYEDAVQDVWDDLRYKNASTREQAFSLQPILVNAFKWRKKILDYRRSHPGHEKDIPVRDLVTSLGQDTFDSSTGLASGNFGTFPFNPVMSTTYLVDKDLAIKFYKETAGANDYYRQTLFDGMGAEIAFLTSASEVMP
ncbi:hypothetical protein [Tunturiibacter lichenicola]|uniref:hypothetical protein n=1 Tax=Tunturiibacter lichenicola TaxID=2051959 RepID=UPI003D9B5CF8